VLQEYADLLGEIPSLPPKRDIHFFINLMNGVAPVSDSVQNEYTRIEGFANAIRRIAKEGKYSPKCLSLGSTTTLCKEERWENL